MPDLEKGTHLQLPQIQCPSVGVNEANDNALANGGRNSTLSSHALLEDPPDCPQNARGIRPYLTVFGAFLALFCTLGQMNSFGTYQTWYATHQLDKLSPSTISWIGSLQLWVFFFSVCLVPLFVSSLLISAVLDRVARSGVYSTSMAPPA